ncbi:peptidyl-glycine alpha-amidating monooxygenase A [Raphidocelis subcapitata]|uniref:Peptidyl-glycine alpha-amidating monooxygenase A n=1 Tax=Raphidocelis subcapitata TaxID=307507 RepID=A0A2V0NRX7_9CHLO|nr:peptidyl-glycine alpha-amidating monooxygenase A [Raphidocelis subcapitata]|eukprot:GBF88303.1 peptidyl-glycine alpha-amidating monooxygenase A [Raphidocelis subcapitata]
MPSERALALQAELQALKASRTGVRVQRAEKGAPGAPFPLAVSARVDAPQGTRVDVAALTVRLSLAPDLLLAPPPPGAARVEVAGDPPLPAPLAAEIAARLHAAWAAAAGAGAGGGPPGAAAAAAPPPSQQQQRQPCLGISAVFDAAERRFNELVAALPQFLEAYEGVDAAGATVRRFALVGADTPAAEAEAGADAPTAEAGPQRAPAAAAAQSAAAPQPAARAAGGGGGPASGAARRPVVPRPAVLPPSLRRAAAGAGSGGAADSDLSWLATKFGAAVRISNGGQQGQSSSQGANGRGQRAPPQDAAQQGPSFSLLLSPTDPAWGQRGPVHVQGAWGPALGGGDGGSGSSGATGSLRLRVLPTPAVPRPLAARLESELARQSEAAAARPGGSGLRSALKWLEQYAGSAAAEAGGAEGSGSSGGGESDEFESGSEDGGGSSGSSSEEGSSGSGEGEGEGGGDAPTGSAPPAEASSGGGRAFGISFEGLQLDAIDALEVLEVTVQLGCSRCGEAAAARLSPYGGGGGGGAPQRGWEWRGKCGKCAQELWCSARPKIVHEANNEIAALKTEGCAPLDLLGGLFGAQCAECSASAALRGVQIGLPCSRACTHCHRPLQLVIPAVAFIPKRAPPPGQRRPKAPRGAGGGGQRGGGGGGEVVPGQPLPMLGTCKHYRHSHRWLRFPCCGTRYPCDLCHEEATDGHEMAWAKRMTCGYCSAEQALAERCATCGKRLATSAAKPSGRNTRFWEGGEGCRDPSSMSRKDPHRYRNSKSKTKSAKASRVGPKPWS